MFGENVLGAAATTVLMAMAPVIELRGALPIGVAAGLSIPAALILSIVGNMLPVPFILLLLRRIFAWLRSFPSLGGLIDRLERQAHLKGKTVKKYRTWGLFILVAIPLPGTGAWTGALVASVLDMRMKTAIPAIFFGVCVAGVIVALVTAGVIHLF